jgi:hypothetical protein
MGWTVGFDFRQGKAFFLYYKSSGPVLEPTQPSIQWVPGTISPYIKRQGREADRPQVLQLFGKRLRKILIVNLEQIGLHLWLVGKLVFFSIGRYISTIV